MYIQRSPNIITHSAQDPIDRLPPGAYRWDLNDAGMSYFLQRLQAEAPKPYSYQQDVIDRVSKFLDSAAEYAALGLTFKRGYLLHGGPGCGKTALMRMLIRLWISRGGIALVGGSENEVGEAIKRTGQPVLVAIDDVDDWNDARLTHALDGLGDVSNVVWVATTNHIDRISKRLQRAGRFDEVLPVTPPPPGDLLAWVAGLPVSDADKAWVTERAEGKTPSEVRELVIRRCILGGIEEPAVPEPTATEKPVSHPVSRKLDGANVVIHNIKLEI